MLPRVNKNRSPPTKAISIPIMPTVIMEGFPVGGKEACPAVGVAIGADVAVGIKVGVGVCVNAAINSCGWSWS